MPRRTSPGTVRATAASSTRPTASRCDLLQFVPVQDDPVKISRLTIENRSGRSRRLSVTAYVEWVLGVARDATAPFIVTEVDCRHGRAVRAQRRGIIDFGDRVAFADLGGRQTAWTGDRTEFLGRNGTLDHPALLERGEPPVRPSRRRASIPARPCRP